MTNLGEILDGINYSNFLCKSIVVYNNGGIVSYEIKDKENYKLFLCCILKNNKDILNKIERILNKQIYEIDYDKMEVNHFKIYRDLEGNEQSTIDFELEYKSFKLYINEINFENKVKLCSLLDNYIYEADVDFNNTFADI